MPIKKSKGKTKMAECLPCTEDKTKNYVPLKAPPKINIKNCNLQLKYIV